MITMNSTLLYDSQQRPTWKVVLQDGFFPSLPTLGLEALRDGLEQNDPGLIQGATVSPPALHCVRDWPAEGACLIGYPFWKTGAETVSSVEHAFTLACQAVDERLEETASCRFLLNAFDDWPRDEMIRNLLPVMLQELERRKDNDQIYDQEEAGFAGTST